MQSAISAILDERGRRRTVAGLVAIGEVLWQSWTRGDSAVWGDSGRLHLEGAKRVIIDAFPNDLALVDAVAWHWTSAAKDRRDSVHLARGFFDPDMFVERFIDSARMREDDRKYFVCAALRERGKCIWSAELRRAFHQYSERVDSLTSNERTQFAAILNALRDTNVEGLTPDRHDAYVDVFLQTLRYLRLLVPTYKPGVGMVRIASGEIDPEYVVASLFGLPTGISGLDQLFGGAGPILTEFNTGSESSLPTTQELMREPCLAGRLILVRGQFGTGKSLLACHLAASVARKGGIATIASVEQGPAEHLYMLTAMGLLPSKSGFETEFGIGDQSRLANAPPASGDGALLFTQAARDMLSGGFFAMLKLAERMKRYPLRLLVIDSLNSLAASGQGECGEDVRGTLQKSLRAITASGVHVVLVEEERSLDSSKDSEEEYLADIVMRLSVVRETAYYKRFIQILKCRFQREQRGEHHMTVASGKGINVVPSPVAVRTRIANRRPRVPEIGDPVKFGIEGIDAILGSPPSRGHVILLEGRAGSGKTQIARAFLRGAPKVAAALELSVGEPRDSLARRVGDWSGLVRKTLARGYSSPGVVFQLLESTFSSHFRHSEGVGRVVIDDVAGFDIDSPLVAADESFGHVLTDYLRRQDGVSLLVTRSVEAGEPDGTRRALMNDADYHIKLLRIAGERGGRALLSVLKSPGMAHASGWFDVRADEVGVTVSRTQAFVQIQGDAERKVDVTLFLFADAIHQARYAARVVAILRSYPNLDVKLVPQDWICGPGALRIEERSGYGGVRIVQLDEFQLPGRAAPGPALCKFKVKDVESPRAFLSGMARRMRVEGDRRQNNNAGVSGPVQGRGQRVANAQDGYCNAVPYYSNIGFLVCRARLRELAQVLSRIEGNHAADTESGTSDELRLARLAVDVDLDERQFVGSMDWPLLGLLSEYFERHHRNPLVRAVLGKLRLTDDELLSICFFQHTGWTEENYNVLYLEILLCLNAPARGRSGEVRLEEILSGPEATQAAVIFRQLCRPGYMRGARTAEMASRWNASTKVDPTPGEGAELGFAIQSIQTSAIVWRHWFTTLGQLAEELDSSVLRTLVVRPLPYRKLPGDCSVAGDWYLGVMADSALPEAGLHLVSSLTTPEAELDRLRRGIGLPTRRAFYSGAAQDSDATSGELLISSHLSLGVSKRDLRRILEHTFRRSQVVRYAAQSPSLSFALRTILEFLPSEKELSNPEGERAEVKAFIEQVLQDVRERSAYVHTGVAREIRVV